MSIQALSWALSIVPKQYNLSATEKTVLIHLADDHIYATDRCWIDDEGLARITGIALETVDKAVQCLHHKGFITVKERYKQLNFELPPALRDRPLNASPRPEAQQKKQTEEKPKSVRGVLDTTQLKDTRAAKIRHLEGMIEQLGEGSPQVPALQQQLDDLIQGNEED